MQLSALKDQVIIRPVVRAEAVRHGVILPPVERESTYRGVVVAVGPTCHELREGDEVLFERYGGVVFAPDGDTLIRFAEADVLAVVERPEGGSDAAPYIRAVLPAVTKDRERIVRT